MKLILYEGNKKYALRCDTAICFNGEVKYGGEHKINKEAQKNELFNNFLKQRWETYKCE